MPRSPFDRVDIRILEQWLTTSKQKLSKDRNTPWDNGESGAEDTETDNDWSDKTKQTKQKREII